MSQGLMFWAGGESGTLIEMASAAGRLAVMSVLTMFFMGGYRRLPNTSIGGSGGAGGGCVVCGGAGMGTETRCPPVISHGLIFWGGAANGEVIEAINAAGRMAVTSDLTKFFMGGYLRIPSTARGISGGSGGGWEDECGIGTGTETRCPPVISHGLIF